MKNIHLIPTEKYSDLVLSTNKYGGLFLSRHYSPMKNMGDSYQNIYITSDKSPNINGYYLLNDNVVCKKDETYFATSWKEREIILTTNIELIADGVQAIDDEFLEWFVKNPSCEWVEVQEFYGFSEDYLIIIPKEEPKQETLEEFTKEVLEDEFFTNISEYKKAERLIEIGAKWQQERMYSEEEVINALHSVELKDNKDYSKIYTGMKEWFKQFKKK